MAPQNEGMERFGSVFTLTWRRLYGREVNAELTFVGSPSLQVNIDHETREITRKNLSGATSACFNEAQAKTRTLMEKDSYPRFLKSASYQDMTKQAASRGTSKRLHT